MFLIELTDDTPDLRRPPPALHLGTRRGEDADRFHDCDGCDKDKPDVDLYAEHPETGEEIWLCMACGEW
jgi:hypothetical protein